MAKSSIGRRPNDPSFLVTYGNPIPKSIIGGSIDIQLARRRYTSANVATVHFQRGY